MEMTFTVNDVIRDLEKQVSYRILWTDSKDVFWIKLEGNSGVPVLQAVAEISNAILTDRYELVKNADKPECPVQMMKDSEIRKRDEVWNQVKGTFTQEPDIFEKHKRAELLRVLSEQSGIQIPNLYKLIQRYWKKGKTPDAFLPDYKNCGRGRKEERKGYKKLGRPANSSSSFGKSLTEKDYDNFENAIRRYYLTRKEAALTAVYDKLLADSYSVRDENSDDGRMKLLPAGEIPSITQFRYWYSKHKDIEKEVQARKGEKKQALTARKVLGKSDYGNMGPGFEYQIDATVGDIYLVSQFNRRNIIGRPVMYFVIDVFSRIVTGMYVGLEGPSWAGAMMALANVAADKVSYCKEFGIDISEDEWPCHHMPSAILGDRGEMESSKADNLVSMLGIRIENAPSYRADLKGIIEQHFRTINTNTTVFLPGKVLPDMNQRGGHDYRLDAKLDIRQFTAIIIRCVLFYNNSHHMDNFEMSQQMMEAGIATVPISLWNWGISSCGGALKNISEEKVRIALLPTGKATVTGKGIKYRNIFYSCQAVENELWFEKARKNGSYKVDISYDPRDMSNILVWDKEKTGYYTCSLLDWESKYTGKQLSEIEYEKALRKVENSKHKANEKEAKINLGKRIDAIVNQAKEMTPSGEGVSKRERISRIRENRGEEKEKIRHEEKFIKEDTTASDAVERTGIEEEMTPVMQLIRQQLMEARKGESDHDSSNIHETDLKGIPE